MFNERKKKNIRLDYLSFKVVRGGLNVEVLNDQNKFTSVSHIYFYLFLHNKKFSKDYTQYRQYTQHTF